MPTTPPSDVPQPEQEPPTPNWDAEQLMRARAAETRHERDQSIAELRESMDDEQILDDFGIDLGEIER